MRVMLDSGAYTAYTQDKIIDLDNYSNFILTNKNYINTVVNLDVINPKDPEVAAEAGRENFLKLRDKGIITVPVFHARERLNWLNLMLDDCSYIGLSGTSLVSPREDRQWHDLVWSYITDSDGFPIADFHSFGNTSDRVLTTYPFKTADSCTWMISGCRAGRIKLRGKTFQLRTKKIGDLNYIDESDTGLKRESWEEEISKLGLNPQILMNTIIRKDEKGNTKRGDGVILPMLRSYLHAADLLDIQEQSRSCTKYDARPSLLSLKKQLTGGVERKEPIRTILVIAPATYYFNYPVIYALGVKDILISYYYISTMESTKMKFWEEKMIPFLEDPKSFLESDEKTRRMWYKLNEVLLKPVGAL
jgi:hypothetical protein